MPQHAGTASRSVASSTRDEDRDISLYDQLKLTAALDAFSLLDTPAELRREPAFLLYTADFSRIQRFIYTVHTEGALRSLRSRSFFLELLMEHYMDELLDGCGLTRTNIIYSGGGHCYLLLPNTAAVQQTLADWNRAFNGWLNEQFGVQLFLANGWTPCSANDLCNVPAEASPYKALFRRVNAIAEQHKQHPYDAAPLRADPEPVDLSGPQHAPPRCLCAAGHPGQQTVPFVLERLRPLRRHCALLHQEPAGADAQPVRQPVRRRLCRQQQY